MDDALFQELTASIRQAGQIKRGEKPPSREFQVETEVRAVRDLTCLSQEKFAKVLNVPVGTIRNWEQGRRHPTGPAVVLLKLLKKHPELIVETAAGMEC